MTATPGDLAVKACKQQLETAMSVIEAITEGSKRMRAAQLTRQFYAAPIVSAPQVRRPA